MYMELTRLVSTEAKDYGSAAESGSSTGCLRIPMGTVKDMEPALKKHFATLDQGFR